MFVYKELNHSSVENVFSANWDVNLQNYYY